MSKFRALLMILLILGLTGCGKPASKRLIGKWKFDPAVASAKTESNLAKDFALAMVSGVAQTIEIEFKPDQTGTYSLLAIDPFSFSWKVLEERDNKVTLEVTNLKENVTIKNEITFSGDNQIQMTSPDMKTPSMIFDRVTEKP
jgi:hypothetical protein